MEFSVIFVIPIMKEKIIMNIKNQKHLIRLERDQKFLKAKNIKSSYFFP